MTDYGDQYTDAGEITADPTGAVRKQINSEPSIPAGDLIARPSA
jgi:hypothetical protein